MKLYNIPYNKDYEDKVIKRILEYKKDIKNQKPIWTHLHWLEEVGMCVDCDAAALLNYSAEIALEKKNLDKL